MRKKFTSLDYHENLNPFFVIRRSKINNEFILLTADNVLKSSDIKEYVIFEEGDCVYIFLKKEKSFELYEINDENLYLVFNFTDSSFFKRSVIFYMNGISVDSNLNIGEIPKNFKSNHVIRGRQRFNSQYKHFNNEEIEINWDTKSSIRLEGFKISEFDLDPEVFIIE